MELSEAVVNDQGITIQEGAKAFFLVDVSRGIDGILCVLPWENEAQRVEQLERVRLFHQSAELLRIANGSDALIDKLSSLRRSSKAMALQSRIRRVQRGLRGVAFRTGEGTSS